MRLLLPGLFPLILLACDDGDQIPLDKDVDTAGLADADGDGYTTEAGDCDDTDNTVGPEGLEVCDNIDNNCDGTVDEGLTSLWYPDADEDGFGEAAGVVTACEPPDATYIADGTDCDDTRDDVYPDAPELCDDVDNDCDGTADEGFPALGDPCDGDDEDLCVNGTIGCSASFKSTTCVEPGPGIQETCDGDDDDCDDEVDEGDNESLCGSADLECKSGVCVPVQNDQPGDLDTGDTTSFPDAEDNPANDTGGPTDNPADAQGSDVQDQPANDDTGLGGDTDVGTRVDVSGGGPPTAGVDTTAGTDGGCGCRVSQRNHFSPGAALLLLALVLVRVGRGRSRSGEQG